MVEVILSIVAIMLILSLAWSGVWFGVFYELSSSLLLFFAMMVSLRYWYEVASWIESVRPGVGSYGALGAYWALFLVGSSPLVLVLRRVNDESLPRYPRTVDRPLGFLFGFISATILVCCAMTSLSVVVPKVWEPYNRAALLLPLDQFPIAVYECIEEHGLGISKTDPGHTRFPTFEKTDADDFEKYWE
jgi:Colicin V production protein